MSAVDAPPDLLTDDYGDPRLVEKLGGENKAYFVTECPDDPDAQAGRAVREAQLGLFGHYAGDVPGAIGDLDHDHEVARMAQLTGMTKQEVERAIFAYRSLQDLPKLRLMQLFTHRLDLDRLYTIARLVGAVGHLVDRSVFQVFDEALIGLFTPTKVNQQLPMKNAITMRLNKLIGDIDSAAAFDPKKRKQRETQPTIPPPGECTIRFATLPDQHDLAVMTMFADNATMAAVRAFVDAAAREHHTSQADALLKLVSGDIAPAPSATIFAYVPLAGDTPDESAAVFIPGFGYTGAVGTTTFHQMAARGGKKIVDMRSASTHTVGGHTAPEDVKAFVRGHDGGCIFPGCTVGARSCQLDHRIPFEEGGATAADNLYCLCQKHHNLKTDRRAFYLPDPVTGEIIWLYADGTYSRVEPTGVLAQQLTAAAPKWERSIDDVIRLKRKTANFFAKSHTVLDRYETEADFTYEQCIAALAELEKEYDLSFPFHPIKPVEEPSYDAEDLGIPPEEEF